MTDEGFNGRLACRFDPARVATPAFVVDEGLLADNLTVLGRVKARTGCRILLALKCFAMYRVFPQLAEVLDGVCCSSPHEARLGREEFGREVHSFAAAYSAADIEALALTSDHLVFNSFAQKERFMPLARQRAAAAGRRLEFGLRINPEHSEGAVPLYDPCAPGSRLGIRRADFRTDRLDGISGLHWHNLCEQDADCLERTIAAAEKGFGEFFPRMEYVNFGGGHHITRPDYDTDLLCRLINDFKQRHGACRSTWRAGRGGGPQRRLPGGHGARRGQRRPARGRHRRLGAGAHARRAGDAPRPHESSAPASPAKRDGPAASAGFSCLAGDVAGEYSFDRPLVAGDRLVFTDMAIYTMVKNNTFNGVQLPAIVLYHPDEDRLETVRRFGYEDFKTRLS